MSGERWGRTVGIGLVVVVGATVAGPTPADAHSCAEPVTVVEDEETTVEVGVTVGDVPAGDVTFLFSGGVEVADVPDQRGWEIEEQEETSVRFTGGPIEANGCALFEVVVRANRAGTFRVRAMQRLDNGQEVEHPPDGDVFSNPDGTTVVVNHQGAPNPLFEQVIEVTEGDEESSARGPLLLGTAAAVALALVVLIPRWKPRGSRPR